MLIHATCKALKEAKVPYAIVGGHAVALHGAVRGTVDIDFIIKWTLGNLKKAEKALTSIGLVSRLPINAESVFQFRDEYIQNRNLIAWNFYDPLNQANQVDLVITDDLANVSVERFRTAQADIRVLSKPDLIAMKKKSGRPQDLEDIKALKKL